MRFKLIHFFLIFGWNGPNSFCRSDTTMELNKGRSLCNIYLNKKTKHEQETSDHFSVNNKSFSALLICSKNLNNIKTASGFYKTHDRESHGTIVKLIYLDLSFHNYIWKSILIKLLHILIFMLHAFWSNTQRCFI